MTAIDHRAHLAPITTAQRHHLDAYDRLATRVSHDGPMSTAVLQAMAAHFRAAVALARPSAERAAAGGDHRWHAEQLAYWWRAGDR